MGTVQGVGFRPWVYRTAHFAGITGRVRNDASGVTIDAFGDRATLARFIDALAMPPPAARIVRVDTTEIAPEASDSFDIVHSDRGADRYVSIPPDLATCDDCAAEIVDPANRRCRYAFTNCTNCGPRFTIATDVPYDRATTTMAPFTMCPSCQREYDDVDDRRFHAQPNACPDCGPRLTLHAANGAVLDRGDPIACATVPRQRWCASVCAETSWQASRSPPIARFLARRACPSRRLEPAWSAAKGPAESGLSAAAYPIWEHRHEQRSATFRSRCARA
jgi:hydrogenase maturation protein HypF